MVAVVVVAPDWSGAVVVDVVSLLVPSEFVVSEVVVEEPSWFSIVWDWVWEYEPSVFVVVELVYVLVEPSWFSMVVSVIVVIAPSSSTTVSVLVFATYATAMFFVVV